MTDRAVKFCDDAEGIVKLAQYLSELTRQGMVYTISFHEGYYWVTLTGGF